MWVSVTKIKLYLVTNEYDGDFVVPTNQIIYCWLGFYFVLFMASYVLHPKGFFRGLYIRCLGKNSDEDFCKHFRFLFREYKASEALMRRWRACPAPDV